MRRTFLSGLIVLSTLLSIAALALAGCTSTPTSTPTPAGPPPPSSTPLPTPAGAQGYMGLEFRAAGDNAGLYDQAQSAGAAWARTQLEWSRMEPERGKYRPIYDRALGELSRRGLHIIATIRENPAWAADTACGPLNETGNAAFPKMLRLLVKHYSVEPYNVKHWEIYNEPDNADPVAYPDLGGCWGKDPAGYVELLKSAYRTIKETDPEAVVIFGGLALEQFEDSPFNVNFLKQVLDAGGGAYFDWMNFHYYAAFSYRWDKFGRGVEGKAAYIRKIMKDAGVDKPLACSEIGQPSAGPAAEKYSHELMMAQVFREHAQALSADLQFVIWYCLQDAPEDVRAYGLLDADLKPKPAYATYQLLARELTAARFERALDKGETGSDKIEAYRFTLPAGGAYQALVIAWRKDNGAALPLPIPAGAASLLDPAGQETLVKEGAAGDLNAAAGALSVAVGPTPALIRY